MRDVTDPVVAAALEQLAREDPKLADAADAGLNSLTWDQGLESITQHGLQEWLWHQLPVKFLADIDAKVERASALARLLQIVDLPRYAALCTSRTTRAVLEAYERGPVEGRAAYRKAMNASGVMPPDVPELAWSDVMGTVEVGAYYTAACTLELAIQAGLFTPGARGWRAAQQALTRTHLLRPRPNLGDECWLDRVLAERVESWLDSRGTSRAELLAGLRDRLLGPAVAAPPDAETHVAPVRWLLRQAVEGVELTQTDRLRPAVVRAFAETFGWHLVPDKRRLEDDVVEVGVVRELARRIGALRRSGRRLVLTTAGRRLVEDTPSLWEAVAARLVDVGGFRSAVEELALAVLLAGRVATVNDVTTAVTVAVAGEGWRDQNGTAPDRRTVRWRLGDLCRSLEVLGLLERPDHAPSEGSWQLNPAGRTTALAALRLRATRPRRLVWDAS